MGGVLVWLGWGARVWIGFSTASLSMLEVSGPLGMGLRMMWRNKRRARLSYSCQLIRIRDLLNMNL